MATSAARRLKDLDRFLSSLDLDDAMLLSEGNRSPDLDAVLQEHAVEFIGESVETLHHTRLALHPTPANPSKPSPKPVGRNDPCPCGSGKKFKKCCLN